MKKKLRTTVNTGAKHQSQSPMTLEERIGERQKEECCGTNHNQYGVCASGKTPYRNPIIIIIRSQEPRKSENGKLKRFERKERRENMPRWEK